MKTVFSKPIWTRDQRKAVYTTLSGVFRKKNLALAILENCCPKVYFCGYFVRYHHVLLFPNYTLICICQIKQDRHMSVYNTCYFLQVENILIFNMTFLQSSLKLKNNFVLKF